MNVQLDIPFSCSKREQLALKTTTNTWWCTPDTQIGHFLITSFKKSPQPHLQGVLISQNMTFKAQILFEDFECLLSKNARGKILSGQWSFTKHNDFYGVRLTQELTLKAPTFSQLLKAYELLYLESLTTAARELKARITPHNTQVFQQIQSELIESLREHSLSQRIRSVLIQKAMKGL